MNTAWFARIEGVVSLTWCVTGASKNKLRMLSFKKVLFHQFFERNQKIEMELIALKILRSQFLAIKPLASFIPRSALNAYGYFFHLNNSKLIICHALNFARHRQFFCDFLWQTFYCDQSRLCQLHSCCQLLSTIGRVNKCDRYCLWNLCFLFNLPKMALKSAEGSWFQVIFCEFYQPKTTILFILYFNKWLKYFAKIFSDEIKIDINLFSQIRSS